MYDLYAHLPRQLTALALSACLLLGAPAAPAQAAEYRLIIQPILPARHLIEAYQPLARYLSDATGHSIEIVASTNFLAYWEAMRRGDHYDLLLDAAHFTDYRVKRLGYSVVAKLPDTVSYTLVTRDDVLLFDAEEMIGKTLATVPSPSLGGVRLSQLYPNPSRQPVMIEVSDFEAALERVLSGKATGALVPSPLISGDTRFNTVLTTEPIPHMALSVSGQVDARTRAAIRDAMVSAQRTPEGQRLLRALNFTAFEPADAAMYDGYGTLLEEMWGY